MLNVFHVPAQVMGRPYRDVISILIEHYGLNTTADELMPIIANIEYDLFRKVEVMPGSMRLLNYLVRNNIPIALATGSSEQKVQIKTGHLPDLIKCFPLERRVTADFHKLQPGRGKPNPDVFIYAAELLGRTTEEQRKRCLVFEDGVPVCHVMSATSSLCSADCIGHSLGCHGL